MVCIRSEKCWAAAPQDLIPLQRYIYKNNFFIKNDVCIHSLKRYAAAPRHLIPLRRYIYEIKFSIKIVCVFAVKIVAPQRRDI